MRFEINKDKLLYHLIVAQKAMSTKTPNPALQGMRLDVLEDHLVITTSNADISIQIKLEDQSLAIESTGSMLIPGKYFIDIIRKLDGQTVTLTQGDDTLLRIEADHSDITLNLLEIEDYPNLVFTEKEHFVKINVRTLKTLIRQTAFATSSIENRPILTGVHVKIDGNRLAAVATDSYRLSQKAIELESDYEPMQAIIPGKSLEELIKILEHNQDHVEVHFDQSRVLFKYRNILFLSRLLEGNYPETSKLIPSDFPVRIKFNKESLLTAIERASLLSNRDSSNAVVKLALRSDDTVEITSNAPEIGRVLEEVYPVDEVEGSPIKIAFSSRYFLEALKVFASSEVTISFTGEVRPFIMTGEYDEDMLQLILPVKTD
ncbi:MAG: DNA polymerase III subunit beta [Acholeplasmatales bacterium]|nr:MAG: DNA polymerase III subunit beta [Acholeplasmatales bacterium]